MNSLTDEKTNYLEQMNRWIKALGLPQYQPSNDEIELILEFTRDALRERSCVQLSEDSAILMQYALFMQQKANECQSFLRWAGQAINRLSENDKYKVKQWVRKAELRLERIQYLARRIELISQSISSLVRARYNEGRNG